MQKLFVSVSIIIATILVAFFCTYYYIAYVQNNLEYTQDDHLYGSLDAIRFNRDGEVIDTDTYTENQLKLKDATKEVHAGDYVQATESIKSALSQPDLEQTHTLSQIAQYRRLLLSEYRITGDPLDATNAVRELKKNILDPQMSAEQKAMSINTLATGPCWFARDEDIIREIYSGEPFSKYWKGDVNQAVHDMLLWSYVDTYPTPKAAASLAYWYTDQVLLNDFVKKTLTKEKRAQYIAEAVRYIREADTLSAAESRKDPRYKNTQRFVGYLYRRAFAVGGLAVIGEATKEEYQGAFDLFFAESERQNYADSGQYIPFAHMLVARFSQELGESPAVVQKHLTQAIEYVINDKNPQSNEISDFIRDKAFDVEGRFSWHAIHQLRKSSPEWDAFVTAIEDSRKKE